MKHLETEIEHVFLDMDGVMADWVGAVYDLAGPLEAGKREPWPVGEYDIEPVLGVTTDRLWALVNRQGVEWWAHLEPLPWFGELLALIDSARVESSILTAPGRCDYALTGKAQWIRNHLPDFRGRLHMTKEKHLLAAPGRLLIDDSDDNCNRFIEAGGAAIVYPQPWNSAHLYAGRPLPSVKRQLANYGIISQEIFEGSENGKSHACD
jgi:hypothetical protein